MTELSRQPKIISMCLRISEKNATCYTQRPDGLEGKKRPYLNKGNIYIGMTTPPSVVKMYQVQFEKDMLLFLRLRHEELVAGGQMKLTFLGRKHGDAYSGGLCRLLGLLSQSVQSLVDEVREDIVYLWHLYFKTLNCC